MKMYRIFKGMEVVSFNGNPGYPGSHFLRVYCIEKAEFFYLHVLSYLRILQASLLFTKCFHISIRCMIINISSYYLFWKSMTLQ